nr:hypothetical protein HmN_000904700 [Hymenolepis microstoma]
MIRQEDEKLVWGESDESGDEGTSKGELEDVTGEGKERIDYGKKQCNVHRIQYRHHRQSAAVTPVKLFVGMAEGCYCRRGHFRREQISEAASERGTEKRGDLDNTVKGADEGINVVDNGTDELVGLNTYESDGEASGGFTGVKS